MIGFIGFRVYLPGCLHAYTPCMHTGMHRELTPVRCTPLWGYQGSMKPLTLNPKPTPTLSLDLNIQHIHYDVTRHPTLSV